MHSNVHATAGTAVVLTTYAITKSELVAMTLGGFLAFLSHDILDYLGEASYGGVKPLVKIEIPLLILFMLTGILSGVWYLFAIGWVGGNLMDLVDKKCGLSLIDKKRFPFTKFFPCHNRKPKIQFTREVTVLAAYVCGALNVIFALLLNA